MTTKQYLTQHETTGLLRLAQTHLALEYLFRHALVGVRLTSKENAFLRHGILHDEQ